MVAPDYIGGYYINSTQQTEKGFTNDTVTQTP